MGGISQVIGALALVGFLGFLAGVGMVVVAASQDRPIRGGILLAIIGLVIGIGLSVVSQGIIVVEPQQRAIVFQTLSGELETPRGPGTHIIIPILQEAVIYPISQQEYTMSGSSEEGNVRGDDAVEARTTDGQSVLLDITVFYSIDPVGDAINLLHVNWRNTYQDRFVRPTVRGLTREVVSGYRAVDIYGESRSVMTDQMTEIIRERFGREGLLLNDLFVRNIRFSDEFTASIERAQIAEQETTQARLRVEQRRQEADQARQIAQGERDAEILRAEGARDSAILTAEGEARSIILRAEAQAEALRLISEQIAANPALIQYEYIQQLSDNVNLAVIPSNSPFLFDFNSLSELPAANADFVAPEVPETNPSANILTPSISPTATPNPSNGG